MLVTLYKFNLLRIAEVVGSDGVLFGGGGELLLEEFVHMTAEYGSELSLLFEPVVECERWLVHIV
jgi:hypothetical protein